MHENDFILEEKVDFEIDGKKFSYKPVNSGDELRWVTEYTEIVEVTDDLGVVSKGTVQNFYKKTMCKLRNLVKVPYGKEVINKVIKKEKDWDSLTKEERMAFFDKLQPKLFTKIINKINEIDKSENSEVKKNS